MSSNGFSPQQIGSLTTKASIAKAHLTWTEYAIKSFLGGVFIALGGCLDLIVVSGSTGLRESNTSLATTIGGFLVPMGFVLITITTTNMELCTSNMFFMAYVTLQGKTTVLVLVKNWVVTYIFNAVVALFIAGFLGWWSNILTTDEQSSYAVTQAEGRVNVAWSVNILRGVG